MLYRKNEGNAQVTALGIIALVLLLIMILMGMMQLSTGYLSFKCRESFEEALFAADCADIVQKDTYNHNLLSCCSNSYCSSGSCLYEEETAEEAMDAAYNAAISRFTESLAVSLKLNDTLVPKPESAIKGLTVDSFIIYNVYGTDIYEYDGGTLNIYPSSAGTFTAPDGNTVTDSGIYAKITVSLSDYATATNTSYSLYAAIRN